MATVMASGVHSGFDLNLLADFGAFDVVIIAGVNGGVESLGLKADIFHNVNLAAIGPFKITILPRRFALSEKTRGAVILTAIIGETR